MRNFYGNLYNKLNTAIIMHSNTGSLTDDE